MLCWTCAHTCAADNCFTGSLPTSLGDLGVLMMMNVHNNRLTGVRAYKPPLLLLLLLLLLLILMTTTMHACIASDGESLWVGAHASDDF